MASIQSPLDEQLHAITLEHLARLEAYVPGPVKRAGGTAANLLRRYQQDPMFSVFGLDSPEYIAATLAGGTITSIHRKIGDIYEGCVRTIFMSALNLTVEQMTYRAAIRSGDAEEERAADTYLQFDRLDKRRAKQISAYCRDELNQLTTSPQVNLVGVGMEIRHCYQTGDSKRTQADEAMARHFLVSGILPIMPLFCNQSNRGIVQRYRSIWVVKEGMESYDLVQQFTGYDFHDFLQRNRDEFRTPVLALLRSLTK